MNLESQQEELTASLKALDTELEQMDQFPPPTAGEYINRISEARAFASREELRELIDVLVRRVELRLVKREQPADLYSINVDVKYIDSPP